MPAVVRAATQRVPLSCNSAADFVTLHAQEALGKEVVLVEGTTYDPGLDKFLPTAELPHENHYEISAKTLEEFKKTLETFKKTLTRNKVDEKLNIQLKEQYGFEDVVSIATKLKDRHEDVDSVKTCMNRIRSGFRSIGRKKGVLANMMSFAPNDSYGVVLCGGFTVILGALDRSESLREELYEVLAEIPYKMKIVNDLLELEGLHKKGTATLHKCADAVFVAMFGLLTIVINLLSKGLARKLSGLLLNGKEYGKDVKDGKRELGAKLEEFKEEAQLCARKSFARVEEKLGDIAMAVHGLSEDKSQRLEALFMQGERGHALAQDQSRQIEGLTAVLKTQLYRFLGSNDLFDPVSGALNKSEVRARGRLSSAGRRLASSDRPGRFDVDTKTTARLGKRWLKTARTSGTDHMSDMEECLEAAEFFSHDDKALIMGAVQSEEVSQWLQHPRSCLLVIEPESSPESVVSPLSFVSALILKTLRAADTSTALAVFCALRAEESTEESVSGPLGLVTQINAQLVKLIVDEQLAVDLSFLKQPKFGRAHEATRPALKLLRKLLDLVSETEAMDATLYMVLDGLSSMSGDNEDVHSVVADVFSVCEETGFTLKVLISDPVQEVLDDSSLDIDRMLVLQLGGPMAAVDGIDSDDLRQDASLAVGLGLRRPRRGRSSSDGSSHDASCDSDSDED